MPSRSSRGTSAIAIALFFLAGCTTFSSADDALVIKPGSGSAGGSVTLGAETSTAAAGQGDVTTEGTVKATDDNSATGSSSGGSGSGGGGSTATDDTADAATIGTYLDKLGSSGPKGTLRTQVVDAVLRACEAFAPPTGWPKTYCWAHLASEMLKESSYNTAASVTDSYATRGIGGQTANDPTVGLLQIRFSSVVHDFAAYGPLDRLASVGCTLPSSITSHASEAGDSSFWAVTGPSANRSLVESVACNVGFGAWYVYLNATGNGKTSGGTYPADYCAGKGSAANLVTGFRAFLEGPTAAYGILGSMGALQSTDGNGYAYINAMKTTFDTMIGTVNGTHPFFLSLAPATSHYCD